MRKRQLTDSEKVILSKIAPPYRSAEDVRESKVVLLYLGSVISGLIVGEVYWLVRQLSTTDPNWSLLGFVAFGFVGGFIGFWIPYFFALLVLFSRVVSRLGKCFEKWIDD